MPLLSKQSRKSPAPKRSSAPKRIDWREKARAVDLEDWYTSEDAKRSFGNLCRAVNVQEKEVHLLGSEQKPLVNLTPAEQVPATQFEIDISIEEVKTDWPAVVMAVMLFGTVFRVSGQYHTHAVLRRNDLNRHGALRYRRPQLENIPQNMSILLDDLKEVSDKFASTTSLIDRRFKEIWREKNL